MTECRTLTANAFPRLTVAACRTLVHVGFFNWSAQFGAGLHNFGIPLCCGACAFFAFQINVLRCLRPPVNNFPLDTYAPHCFCYARALKGRMTSGRKAGAPRHPAAAPTSPAVQPIQHSMIIHAATCHLLVVRVSRLNSCAHPFATCTTAAAWHDTRHTCPAFT